MEETHPTLVLSPQSFSLHFVHGDDAKAAREIVARLRADHSAE